MFQFLVQQADELEEYDYIGFSFQMSAVLRLRTVSHTPHRLPLKAGLSFLANIALSAIEERMKGGPITAERPKPVAKATGWRQR